MSITAKPPYKYFTDTTGKELESGKIYVGIAGLDAEANPITAYWDPAATIAATQPIRTIGGAPDNSGTPSDFFTVGDYSITVRDKNDVLVYSKLQLNANDLDALLLKTFDTVADFLSDTTLNPTNTPVGSIVNYGGFRGISVASGGDISNSAGTPVQLDVLPDAAGELNAKAFGAVGDNSTDDTTALQAMINACLASELQTMYAPSGHYKFSTLVFRNASGSNRELRGKITLRGDGQLAQQDVWGSVGERYGTIFESTSTTSANAFVISDNDTQMRAVRLDNLSVIYGGTGYAVQAEYCPDVDINMVSIKCTAAGSKALLLKDVWHGRVTHLITMCDTAITSTVAGVVIDASLFAGSLRFQDCQIDGFNDCVSVPSGGANFTNLTFENCSIQRYHRYGWYIEAPIWNFALRDCYTESESATTCLKATTSAGAIANLRIDGLFVLGGITTAAWLTGPAIDIDAVDRYTFKNIKYFRPWTALLNIGDTTTYGTIEGLDVHHDNSGALPTGPLYMLTGGHAEKSFSVANYVQTVTAKIELFDTSAVRISQYDSQYLVNNSMSNGPLVFAAVAASVYDMANASPRPMAVLVTATGGGSGALRLPRANTVKDTDTRYIMNDPASTQSLGLRNGSLGSTIHTLAPGEGTICIADSVNDKWLIIPGAGSYGT